MNRYRICFGIILLISCSAPKNEKKDINQFLELWAKSLSLKDKMVKDFYDPAFEFPALLVEDAAGLSYTLYTDSIKISGTENSGDIFAEVSFQLLDPKRPTETGKMKLTIGTTATGYVIKDMSQELTMEVLWRNRVLKFDEEYKQRMKIYDSIWTDVRSVASALQQHYDTVVYFTQVDDQVLFYVANGDWKFPYPSDSIQYDSGNYKLGVVTATNKTIVPVEYSKIYNPGGTIRGVIEVERNGLRGLFKVTGEQLIPAEYDGIYPTQSTNALAQLKKGDQYGWLQNNGRVSFDASSHPDKSLFISPIESRSVLDWQFNYPGTIKVLIDMTGNAEYCNGVVVYPSFLRDLGITKVANPWVLNDVNEMGMGMTDTEIKFEKVESLSDKLFGLVAFFMEAGADARGYQTAKTDLLVVDRGLNLYGYRENLTVDNYRQDPCNGKPPSYKTIEPCLYESHDGHGRYDYYKITAEGTVEQLKTTRKYNFTKFARIDESYFDHCRYEHIEYDESNNANLVLLKGLSSEELDVMRNEIFAEYGFVFKTPKWNEYFSAMPWYQPRHENVDQFLTETDKANIKFILDYKQLHKNIKIQRDSMMYGWAG